MKNKPPIRDDSRRSLPCASPRTNFQGARAAAAAIAGLLSGSRLSFLLSPADGNPSVPLNLFLCNHMKNKLPPPPNTPHQQLLIRAINYFRSREGEPRLFTKRKLVLLLLTAAYAFSPIDLIPDFIPGVGQLDDLTVIAFAFLAMFLPPIRKDGSHEDPEP
ncbi:hypothetical protein HMPREF3038_01438 [Akkermansia sp. KLE1797]|nr:hypothetical protein HMPREF3038_01438 [Akkermansia sp. KLE1797]